MARQRAQLVIGLGEGTEGERRRKALDAAAKEAGMPVTAWARDQLLQTIGAAPLDPVIVVHHPDKAQDILLDLKLVSAIRVRGPEEIVALLDGKYEHFMTEDPEGIVSRWKRVHRGV